MKKRLVIDLSANTLQLVVNQLFGVLIFYVLSVNLDKNSFGQLNLALGGAVIRIQYPFLRYRPGNCQKSSTWR
jgi:hypothetical protein